MTKASYFCLKRPNNWALALAIIVSWTAPKQPSGDARGGKDEESIRKKETLRGKGDVKLKLHSAQIHSIHDLVKDVVTAMILLSLHISKPSKSL